MHTLGAHTRVRAGLGVTDASFLVLRGKLRNPPAPGSLLRSVYMG